MYVAYRVYVSVSLCMCRGGMPVLGECGICSIYDVCFCEHVRVQVDTPM